MYLCSECMQADDIICLGRTINRIVVKKNMFQVQYTWMGGVRRKEHPTPHKNVCHIFRGANRDHSSGTCIGI
jgi:hypothetical protein